MELWRCSALTTFNYYFTIILYCITILFLLLYIYIYILFLQRTIIFTLNFYYYCILLQI
jgi:hypothetical protein